MLLHKNHILTGLLVATLTATSGCSNGVSDHPVPDASEEKYPLAWSPRTGITLLADDFYIIADGQKYLGTMDQFDLHSDAGNNTYTTLEAKWMEHGVEMRLSAYFHSDGNTWWSDEIRTYNGKAPPAEDWIIYKGAYFASPVGQTFTGNLDLTSDQTNTVPGSLHF